MTVADKVAFARTQFRLFRIPLSRLSRIAEELDALREIARLSREQWDAAGRRGKRPEQKFLPIIGPSGAGKSTAIAAYAEALPQATDTNHRFGQIVHVTLSAQATTKRLGSDILEAYEDPDFEQGSATKLLRRANNHIEMARTRILVLDEIHHLIDNDKGGKTAWSVTETIKKILISGTCPLVLVGTELSLPLLTTNNQLKNRGYPPIILPALDLDEPLDRQTFLEHVAGFDLKLVEHKIFARRSNLVAGDIPACVYDVSRGIIGVAANLFENAAVAAIRRNGDSIERRDLQEAVRTWAIPFKVTDYDPFEHGARELKVKKVL